jgi:ribosomal protein S13
MIKVQVENLVPGMQLAKPIMNKAGIVLLGKGTELTETWIRRIQDMELDEAVWVEGKVDMEVPLEEMLAALENRFRTTQGNKQMDMIKRATEKHIRGLYE